MARRPRPHWGFGDVATPPSPASPAPTADQLTQAGQVALQTEQTMAPTSSDGQVHDATEQLKQAMIQVAVQIAAVQMAVSILLDELACIVPFGTIIAAVLAVIQIFTGAYAKRKVAEIVAATVNQIKAQLATIQSELQAQAMAVANQEWQNAEMIAASSVALNGIDELGLGTWGVFRNFSRALIAVHRDILKAAVNIGAKSAEETLKLVGDNHDAAKVAQKDQQWNNFVYQWGNRMVTLMARPQGLVEDILGTEGIPVAKAKCAALGAAASAQAQQQYQQALVVLASDAYRQQVRVNIAKLIRGDPDMLAKAQQMWQMNAEAQQTLAQVDQAARTGNTIEGVSSKSGTGIFGTMALVGLWAWLA